ncbi:hypothetical protein [Burkholderia pseudomultivorans]|uniref:hypothetical protein n=1 Tax=Burkholderia pseudomultivorans TaxID=1207504 RepID=UPI003A5C8237
MNRTIVARGRFERGEFIEIELQHARWRIGGRRDARIDMLRYRLVHDHAVQAADTPQRRDIEQRSPTARTGQEQADLHGHAASQGALARASR